MPAASPSLTLRQLASIAQGELRGDPEYVVEGIATLNAASSSQVAALTTSHYRSALQSTAAGCVILAEQDAAAASAAVIVHRDPALAFARVANYFHPLQPVRPSVAASALIDVSASVDPSAEIAAGVIIGANTVIGADVLIGPGCVILDAVSIGAGTRLIANVTLCQGVQLGERCILHPGAVIGADGFGFANEDGRWLKIPQSGSVIVGNDVEVGASTTIDRGSLRDTVIGDGVKLDNQIQIGHNVTIGEHTAIASSAAIAGSTTIGSHCLIAGMAGVVGHISIGDNCVIAAHSPVTHSIEAGTHYSGIIPAMPVKPWRKIVARLRHLDALFEQVSALQRRLGGGDGKTVK
jgi:UDP-3-O-[3-hydroxymyristoyl] glucosamine N-acyltransferase